MHPFITVAIFIGTTMMANGQKRLSCNSNDQPVSKIAYSAGSLSGFYNLAKGFIHLVQKSDIPYDKMQALKDYVDDGTDHSAKEIMDKVNPILVYEAGLIALLVIGILYCVLMPFVGAIFCCCRCCGNCGGKRYQEAPVSTSYCFAYIAVLIAIFAFMLTGCLLYGLNNNKAWHEVWHVYYCILIERKNELI